MQMEFDELIKRILQLLSEKDKLTAEQRMKMYQRVFPVNEEAKDNGKEMSDSHDPSLLKNRAKIRAESLS